MEKELGERGLSVLAVTDESASQTEAWIEKYKAEYAYAYDKGGKLSRWAGVSGIPHAVLVNGFGDVVWKGHPGGVNAEMLEPHLAGALPKPLWGWPKSAKAVSSAVGKGDLAKALEKAQSLKNEDERAEYTEVVKSLIAGKLKHMQALNEKGDFLGAYTLSSALKKQLGKLPEAEQAKQLAEKLSKDKDVQKVIKGQKALAKLAELEMDIRSRKKAMKLRDELRELSAKYPGTIVAEQAEAISERVMGKRY